ncbi:MAG: polysaccharide biosynthesis C-terminal domain-containing protein [Tepidamorphaceae bacterium]
MAVQPEFTVGYTVMLILAVGHVAKAYSGQAEMCLSMIGHHKQAAFILIGTMVLNIAINLTLIPVWGVNGCRDLNGNQPDPAIDLLSPP